MSENYLVPVTEMLDFTKIEDYNQEFIKSYPNQWQPFVTRENFSDYLKRMNDIENGINNDGIKEKFYWLIDKNKIVGSGSIRLNPEIDGQLKKYAGHIFYQIVPTYRKQGYGKLICYLLLKEMRDLGFEEAIVTCYDTNVSSIKIIESNGGELIETVMGDGSPNSENLRTRRYKINIEKALLESKINNIFLK